MRPNSMELQGARTMPGADSVRWLFLAVEDDRMLHDGHRGGFPTSYGQMGSPLGPGAVGGAYSSGGSGDSRVGPLLSPRLHLLSGPGSLETPKDPSASPRASCGCALVPPLAPPPSHGATSVRAAALPPRHSTGNSALNISSGSTPPALIFPSSLLAVAGTSNSGGGAAAAGGTGAAAGSCASSVASHTSGVTTTSRPSRWGLLAGILSAGLHSFSQLAGVVEPETGNLTLEAVHDLTRRASRLDVVRAAGQVIDLSLVGSGSMGLVYRGRLAADCGDRARGGSSGGGTVCVKYLVARGADGMAAPATEGLLSRALVHPNIVRTFSWHVTRVTSDNFLDLPEALVAMAALEQRRHAKRSRRRGNFAAGKGRRTGGGGDCTSSSSGLHPLSLPTTLAAAARATPSASTTPLPAGASRLIGSGGVEGGGDNGVGCSGGACRVSVVGSCRHGSRRKASCSRAASATFAAHVLELVRSSAGGADVGRAASARSHGCSPHMRMVSSRHQSFTGGTAVAMFLRASAASRGGRFGTVSALPALPIPLLPAQPPQRYQPLERRSDFDDTWSVPRADFYRTSDLTTCSIVQQGAVCDANAAAAAATAGMAGPSARRSGTIASFFSRDSTSSTWFLASPNPSNHAAIPGSSLHLTNRSTTYGVLVPAVSGGGAGATGDNSLLLGTTPIAGTPPATRVLQQSSGQMLWACSAGASSTTAGAIAAALQPSAPVAICGGGGCGGGTSGGRGRGMLVRVGSRLQFATTPNMLQPSIPEDFREMSVAEDLMPPRHTVPMPDPRGDAGLQLMMGSHLGGDEKQSRYVEIPSINAGAGKQLCVATATAKGPAAAGPSFGSSTATGGSGGGGNTGESSCVEGEPVLRACFMAQMDAPNVRMLPQQPDRRHREVEGGSSDHPRVGLLTVALAATSTQGQSWNHSRSGTSSSGIAIGTVGRPLAAPHTQAGSADSDLRQPRGGGGGGGTSQSRTVSTVLSPSMNATSATSSAKHLSSTVNLPNLPYVLSPGDRGRAAAVDLTPSVNGSEAAAAASSSMHDGAPHMGSNSDAAGSAPAAVAAEGEGEAARQETLERGWRTLQQIMQRLNAKPGDYLTRIVMEDADQGSLLIAMRSGRFGVDNERLRVLLLTALDIACGMAFLHKHNVIHGDLKPSNVSDFGLSRIISRNHESVQNRDMFPAGTVRYLAPEAVSGASFKASDVWSFAVVLWQLVTGEQAPWPGLRSMQVIMGVMQDELRLRVPPSVYPPLAHLIESCLAHDHKKRPTFNDIVAKLQAMLRDISRCCSEPQLHSHSEATCALGGPASDAVLGAVAAAALEPAPLPRALLPPLPPPPPLQSSDAAAAIEPPRQLGDRPAELFLGAACSQVACEALAFGGPVAVPAAAAYPAIAAAAKGLPPFVSDVAVATMLQPGIAPTAEVAATAAGAAAAAAVAAASGLPAAAAAAPLLSQLHTRSSEATDVDETQLHIIGPGESESGSRSGSASESRSRSPVSSAVPSEERERRPQPLAVTDQRSGNRVDIGAGGVGVGSGGGGGGLPTPQGSLAATSIAITAAASSNALTQMSCSWAHTITTNTNTTTTLATAMLDRDTRSSAACAWPSGVLHLATSANAHTSTLAGFGTSAGLNQLSRNMVGSSTGGSTGTAAMAQALERQCSIQDLHGKPRTAFLGAVLPDDVCGGGRVMGPGASQLTASMATYAALAATGNGVSVCGGANVNGAFGGGFNSPRIGGGFATYHGSAAAAATTDGPNPLFLPPVHEEQPSSGLHTALTHGSGLSSGYTQLSAGGPAASIAITGSDRRTAATTSSESVSAGYGGPAEGSLPRMLQAGLIVLGVQDSAPTRIAAGHVPGSVRGTGSTPSTGQREDLQL
ncbi:hypothetical protein VOLCADRAFT_121374 [Volvox carteri f. nagariensis]|uniref:Protein kinase domain-containing protein n=1 Tax=Volvox carteri f. nagariensis TaxID=3068 RepID=D8U8V5_VOLCA|nr:uncharacterized protein VOLCADRAFT_121374 [Volvox carteri f. nagariensis]EFJ43872.1 hypothetical protein VOLCADRAFT_121374 [Volvox carteri f. nagariensis]|eukprot:XP_002955118.1 hypothetical protein VOLCADRAFT_121374 [Volvox carteri f. nagariensis]